MSEQQERLLPIANVGRVMKQILPPSAKISKEAKQTIQECATEFISFVAGEASEKCRKESRKTMNGDDVCWALGTLGFDDYAAAISRYLQRYRQHEREKERNKCENQNNVLVLTQQAEHDQVHEGTAPLEYRFMDKDIGSTSKPSTS